MRVVVLRLYIYMYNKKLINLVTFNEIMKNKL